MQLPILLIQICVILGLSNLLGWLFHRLRQPRVIGEICAGLLLGPSFLGWLFPNISATVFPPSSLDALSLISQLGLLLFMFLVGLEFDPRVLKKRGHAAVVISHASIIVPFCLGIFLAFYLYPTLASPGVPLLHFVLFIGLAMSITAFPVLARILTERNLLHTSIGVLVITCAAVDDVTAWCILALVVFLVRASNATLSPWFTVVGSLLYISFMFIGMRRFLRNVFKKGTVIAHEALAFIFLLILASGWITETLGIHALFGAFLVGVIMPKDEDFDRSLSEKIEGVTVVLLLPLYFAFTGLRTSIGLLNSPHLIFYCLLVIVLAILGKLGGATIAARIFGLSWREASTIGTLMNTRGLIELVILNIGLDIGVISSTVFTMMVLMAIVTTFMTSPLLEWLKPSTEQVTDMVS